MTVALGTSRLRGCFSRAALGKTHTCEHTHVLPHAYVHVFMCMPDTDACTPSLSHTPTMHTQAYTHVCTHPHRLTRRHARGHACVPACSQDSHVHTRSHACTHAHTFTCAHIYAHMHRAHAHTCSHVCLCAPTHAHTRARTCTRVSTHVCTRACTCSGLGNFHRHRKPSEVSLPTAVTVSRDHTHTVGFCKPSRARLRFEEMFAFSPAVRHVSSDTVSMSAGPCCLVCKFPAPTERERLGRRGRRGTGGGGALAAAGLPPRVLPASEQGLLRVVPLLSWVSRLTCSVSKYVSFPYPHVNQPLVSC